MFTLDVELLKPSQRLDQSEYDFLLTEVNTAKRREGRRSKPET